VTDSSYKNNDKDLRQIINEEHIRDGDDSGQQKNYQVRGERK
jgi:hypothetical protein